MNSCSCFGRRWTFLLGASLAMASAASTASAAILYQETFDDATLQAGSAQSQGTVAGGDIDFVDPVDPGRARFTVLQNFSTASLLTFSFKISAVITQPDPVGAEDPPVTANVQEVLIRVGPGTTQNTASSTQDVLEAVIFRDGNRGAFTNSGDETIFLIANNSASSVNYTDPVTNTTATLPAFTYASYVRNDTTSVFGVLDAGPDAFQDGDANPANGPDPLTRLGIGSATNANEGTFSLDNILVVDEISFLNPIPEPTGLALIGVGGLLALRRRRSA